MKDLRRKLGRRLLALMLVVPAVMVAQTAQGPRELFERARLAEENVRTLGRALELYRQVVAEAGADRALAAEAELRAALVLERQGKPEAREALAAVAKTYADLPAGAAASTRLAEASSQALALAPRLIRNDINFPRSFSFDGQRALVLVPGTPGRYSGAPKSLAIQNMASGELTTLVEAAPDGAWPGCPVFSPDGRQVAYAWTVPPRASPDGRPARSVQIVAAQAGATPRALVGPTTAERYAPLGWSPDSRSLLVLARLQPEMTALQLLRVSVPDGHIQHVTTFEPYQDIGMEPGSDFLEINAAGVPPVGLKLSPTDGQTLAYSAINQPGSEDRYIYTLNTTTREQTALVTMAGVNTRPTWSPDGSQLFFVNEQSGRRALWVVDVRGGAADGDPRLVQADFQGSPIDMSVTGHLYSVRRQYAGFVESVAERNPSGSPIVQTFRGQSGIWSRGNKLAFIRRGGGDVADLIVRDMSTGEERTYRRPGGFGVGGPRWLPDDSGLIVFLPRNLDPQGAAFHRLDIGSGRLDRLFEKDTDEYVRSGVVLVSHDGRSLLTLVRLRPPADPTASSASPRNAPWTGVAAFDLATDSARLLVTFPEPGLSGPVGMALSPDGQTLALAAQVEGTAGRSRLITVGIDGSNWREIHTYDGLPWDGHLRWTPDGQSLLFIEGIGSPTWRMMQIPAAGGLAVFDGLDSANFTASVPLPTYEIANIASFDVSPDGRRIIFGSRTVPNYDVTVLENLLAYVAR